MTTEPKNIALTAEQVGDLTIMLNIKLRNRLHGPNYWHRVNGIFRQLVGDDHENIEHYGDEPEGA